MIYFKNSCLFDSRSVQILHVKRVGNKPTHIIAQYVKGLDNYVAWVKKCPVIIETALAHDVWNLSSF